MKQLDTYLDLCTRVYDLDKKEVPEDAYAFYRSFMDKKDRILEPMCGSGRFLLPLFKEGYNVDGFDASDSMLDALLIKAKDIGLEPNVSKRFVEDLNSKKKYDKIFIPCGSFGLIVDDNEVSLMLQKFYKMLNKGGKFLFEVETFTQVPDSFGSSESRVYKSGKEEMILATFCPSSFEHDIFTTFCRYELVQGNTIVKTEIEEFKRKLYDPELLLRRVKEIGFSQVVLHKAFVKEALPEKGDDVVVFECKK
ncbi:MAG: hypothetical protein S4CHLAM27_05920 [Chlamydiia bacterium]|nr:hypothetical protein [Chlamydiia bacterium]